MAAAATVVSNGADTAWIIVATALVLFMTLPGLALFYGGLVRSKSVLVTIVWSGVVSAGAFFLVDKLVGMRVPIEVERGGLDLAEHQEQAYEIV